MTEKDTIFSLLESVRADRPNGEHSPYGGSQAARILACPPSLRLARTVPQTRQIVGAAAAEGTRAHEMLEDRLRFGFWNFRNPEITDPLESVIEHLETIRADHPDAIFLFEETFRAREIHKDCWGTADVICVSPSSKLLIVGDLKFGKGILVEPEENAQLMLYAFAAARRLGLVPDSESKAGLIDTVRLEVYQPRIEHKEGLIRSWSTTPERLVEFAFEYRDTILRSEQVDLAPTPGEKQCRFCPAAPGCPAHQTFLNRAASEVFSTPSKAKETLDTLDPQDIGALLDQFSSVEAFMKAVREYAFSRLNQGDNIPGYKLVAKRKHRAWHPTIHQGQSPVPLSQAFGVKAEQLFNMALKSPAQVEKLVGKVKFSLECQKHRLLDTRESSDVSMVGASDKRPAIQIKGASDVFEAATTPADPQDAGDLW